MIYIFHLFVSYITCSALHSFLQIASWHHLQVIWSFPRELCVAALVGADYWMHGWYGQPLEWPDCPIWIVVVGYFVIPYSRESGNGGDDTGMAIIFDPRGVRPSSLVFWKALLMHVNADYCELGRTSVFIDCRRMHIRRKFYVGIAAHANNTL